jgi:hypothetical protein
MLVLALLGMVMMLAVPAFQSLLQGSLEREINRLTGVVRLLRNEAVLTRRPFRIVFYLKQAKYQVEERTPFGEYVVRQDPKSLRPHRFPESFVLREMVVFGSRFDRLRDQPVPVSINASGFIQPFLLHFSEDGELWTLKVEGFSAEMKLVAGEVGFEDQPN